MENSLQNVNENKPALAGSRGMDLGTMRNINPQDIRMPYVYLVRANSGNATLKDGNFADAGTFYNSKSKEAKKKLEVLICHASSGNKTQTYKDDAGVERQKTIGCYRLLCVTTDALNKPFLMTVSGVNHWGREHDSLAEFMSNIAYDNKTNLDVVVTLTAKKVKTDHSALHVIEFKATGDTTDEQKALMFELSKKYGAITEREDEDEVDEDTTPKTVEASEDVNIDELLEEIEEAEPVDPTKEFTGNIEDILQE